MYYSIITLIKVIFTGVQVFLALVFIVDAVDNWQRYPTVTSVEFKKIEKELFPAVTVCYPNTWKWPGIVKVLSKWGQSEEKFDINKKDWYTNVSSYGSSEQIWYQDIFFNIGKKKARSYTNTQVKSENLWSDGFFCTIMNGWTTKQQKFGRFILNMIEQIQFKNSKLEFRQIISLEDRWKNKKPMAFESIKSEICQLEHLDCKKRR